MGHWLLVKGFHPSPIIHYLSRREAVMGRSKRHQKGEIFPLSGVFQKTAHL
jgi:hypothetical protein